MSDELRCSFCRKSEHQVRKLVSGGGGGYICDACVAIAARIMRESDAGTRRSGAWRRLLSRVRSLIRGALRAAASLPLRAGPFTPA